MELEKALTNEMKTLFDNDGKRVEHTLKIFLTSSGKKMAKKIYLDSK